MTTTMPAYRLLDWQQPAAVTEVPVPEPGPDQVLVRVAGVGLCHSDLLFLDAPPGRFDYPVPYTLGHEVAGWVERTGSLAADLHPGDAVVLCAHRLCGRCDYCVRGLDNYCTAFHTGLGFGQDGGLASYVVVDRSAIVGPTTLDPTVAGPLADAGKTSYHAVRRALPRLVPGTTAVVIGVGGLGAYAVQYLRLLAGCRIVAVDVSAGRLARATSLGADATLQLSSSVDDRSGEHRVAEFGDELLEALDGRGAEAVFDFVGDDATLAAALRVVRSLGAVALVGAAGGTARVSWATVAGGVDVFIPHGGTMADMREVVALAESGRLTIEHQHFSFDQVDEAYRRLRAGTLDGRAIVLGPTVPAP